MRVEDKLYYTVLLAPNGQYDLNTGNKDAPFFWSYIDSIYLYSYDCKTKKIRQLSDNLKKVVKDHSKYRIISTAAPLWKKGNIIALSI